LEIGTSGRRHSAYVSFSTMIAPQIPLSPRR
jgi:hypothetical protein